MGTQIVVIIPPSALGKNRPFLRLPKVTHTKNTICPVGKENGDIIHAEGVRFAVASSAQRGPWKAASRQEFIGLACGPETIPHREIAAWQAGGCRPISVKTRY